MKNARVDTAPVALAAGRSSSRLVDYIALTKPRLNLLVVITSAAGYYLASPATPALGPLIAAVIGTALVASGAAVLNQVYERDTDALMERTRRRPLPDGRVPPGDARVFGVILAVGGVAALVAIDVLAALLAVATLAIYVVIYTPLKRRSSLSTLVGAVPGALPPLIGWTAAHHSTFDGGWALFTIVFLWQIPHFMAIAWMYRDDYGKAGFPMLPVLEPDGVRTGRQAVLYSAALVPASLVPASGVAGMIYLWTALVLGLALFALAVNFARSRSDGSARLLFYGTITYLPLLWAAMILDH